MVIVVTRELAVGGGPPAQRLGTWHRAKHPILRVAAVVVRCGHRLLLIRMPMSACPRYAF